VIKGRTCVDGGVIENIPLGIPMANVDAVIAVDVGSTSLRTARRIKERGFAAIFLRSAQTMMRSLQTLQLAHWAGPPLLLVRPAVWDIGMFSFNKADEMIRAGYEAAIAALDEAGEALWSAGGVHPVRAIELSVDRAACVGCGVCVSLAPHCMAMDTDQRARVIEPRLSWSRADGDFVHQCPTGALSVTAIDGDIRRRTMEMHISDLANS
jgi:ferredoxin